VPAGFLPAGGGASVTGPETKAGIGVIVAKPMWCESHIRAKAGIRQQNTSPKPHFDHEATDFRADVNMSFTEDSRSPANMPDQSDGTSEGQGSTKMAIWTRLTTCAFAVREFIAPTYRPERHYMRGPGPACARRRGVETLHSPASFRERSAGMRRQGSIG
jgi:hypothetical protein